MIDLHCHSTTSDGAHSPEEVVRMAVENGCTMLSLTDHDNTAGLTAARLEAQKQGICFINGVEISVTWRGRTIHIVGLDFDEQNDALQQLLQTNRAGRIERAQKMAEKLAKKGIEGAFEAAMQLAPNPENISRTHLAEFLVAQGIVRTKQQAFSRYLGDGKSCSVRHEWCSLEEAVAAIVQAKGLAVIAHPMRYDLSATAKRNLFEQFKNAGGHAIEVHSGRCSANDSHNYALLAQRHQLLSSCGSDFHRLNDYSGGVLGACPKLPEISQPVWQHFK